MNILLHRRSFLYGQQGHLAATAGAEFAFYKKSIAAFSAVNNYNYDLFIFNHVGPRDDSTMEPRY
jgi:hypothetical protein